MAPSQIQKTGHEWSEKYKLRPLADDAKVTFVIPLIAAANAELWFRVQLLLRRTVRSLIAQSCPDWRVVICGQDRPDAVDLDHRIEFMQHDEERADESLSDKPAKVRRMVRHLTSQPGHDGYFYMLDADDILHPSLVKYMIETGDQSGYIVTRGFMMNAVNNEMGYLGFNRFRSKSPRPFYDRCGSCAAIRMDTRDDSRFMTVLSNRGKHHDYVHTMAAFGIYLHRVPFAAAIYFVNHGENLQARRGRMDNKLRYIAENLISAEKQSEALAQFRFDALRD